MARRAASASLSTLLQAVTNTQVSREGGPGWQGACGRWPALELPASWLPFPGHRRLLWAVYIVDIKESAAYLALLTRGLQRLYQVSRLHQAPSVHHRPSPGCCAPARKARRLELPCLRLAP